MHRPVCVVFLCCMLWYYGDSLSIEDKQISQSTIGLHVIVKNVSQTSEDALWTVGLKMIDNLEIAVTRSSETPGKRKKLGYYKFYSTPATWFGAKKICEQEGTRLLVLNSEREFTTIKSVWDTYPKLFDNWTNNFIHIGLHDLLQEGHYITLDEQTISETGYSKWDTNEPSHGTTANCLRASRDGLYYDSYCNNLFAFFCEM